MQCSCTAALINLVTSGAHATVRLQRTPTLDDRLVWPGSVGDQAAFAVQTVRLIVRPNRRAASHGNNWDPHPFVEACVASAGLAQSHQAQVSPATADRLTRDASPRPCPRRKRVSARRACGPRPAAQRALGPCRRPTYSDGSVEKESGTAKLAARLIAHIAIYAMASRDVFGLPTWPWTRPGTEPGACVYEWHPRPQGSLIIPASDKTSYKYFISDLLRHGVNSSKNQFRSDVDHCVRNAT